MQVAIHVQVLDNLNKKFLDAAKGSFSEYVQVYYFMTGMSCVGEVCGCGWMCGRDMCNVVDKFHLVTVLYQKGCYYLARV
jgi:hypothetical protein